MWRVCAVCKPVSVIRFVPAIIGGVQKYCFASGMSAGYASHVCVTG